MENRTLAESLTVFDHMVEQVEELNLPRLGPTFRDLTAGELADALVAHRILNKYEKPGSVDASMRKTLSITEVIRADENGWVGFDYRTLETPERKAFLHAKAWLANFFKDFTHSYRLRFPSNETYVSARGRTDLLYKLGDLKQWTVSPDAVHYCVEIICREKALKSVVKNRFKAKYGDRGKDTLARVIQRKRSEGATVQEIRKVAIHFMFRACCTLTRLSRVTTVPKDNARDRVITCECLWTMVAQLSFAASIRDHLRRRLGINLETLQDVHRTLIRSGAATIDFSKASDTNYMCVLRSLWPPRMVKTLERLRTGVFEYKESGETKFHPLRMFAPMGCGCTFEVMTLTLLAYGRAFSAGCSVFGDDVIIDKGSAKPFIRLVEAVGWKVNSTKSYIEGNFRESCGAFCALDTQEFLISYDIHRPKTMREVYTTSHKLLRIIHALKRGPLRSVLVQCYAKILLVIPRDSLGVMSEYELSSSPLSEHIFYVPDSVWRQRVAHRSSRAIRCLEGLLQRRVQPVQTLELHTLVNTRPSVADVIHTAAYLRRGASYDVPTGKRKTVFVTLECFSGSRLHDFTLANVLK